MIHIEQAPPYYDGEGGMNAFRQGHLHVVCSACNGLSYLNVIAHDGGEADESFNEQVNGICALANRSGEPATLYPKRNISVFAGWNSEPWRNPPCDDEREVLKQLIRVIQINEDIVKCSMMFINDDQGCFTQRALNAALGMVNAWEAQNGEFQITRHLLHF